MPVVLSAAQLSALHYVRGAADRRRTAALERIGELPDLAALVAGVREHGRVTLNFHPDRLVIGGRTVAESIALDGRYRSQYETGHSNGSATAFPGGDRDRWEERMFGGAYHAVGVPAGDRPKYGGLNLMNHSDGASPRFGSCHVRLRPEVVERCTFSFGDSHLDPADWGTIDSFLGVLAALLEGSTTALALLRDLPGNPVGAAPGAAPGRTLDDYVEAQVHGDLDLARHAEAIVMDPSFRGTATGELLAATAQRCGIGLEWHAGFRVAAAEIPADFRGPVIPPFAAVVCAEFGHGDGIVDAEIVGRAAATVRADPDRWARWGSPTETLQYLKKLWHVLVQFGEPAPH